MTHLLDTNTCIYVVNQKPQKAVERMLAHDPAHVGVSTLTIAELLYGAEKSQYSRQNHLAIDEFLLPLIVKPYDSEAAARYGAIRADLERQGTPIGPLDMPSRGTPWP